MAHRSRGLVRSRDKLKHTSTSTMPMTIEPGRVVTYHEGRPTIMSHEPLNTWSREVT